jgi:hypothetical protein
MPRLWNDIKDHQIQAVLFLLYWLIAFGLDAFGWRKPENRPDMVLMVVCLHLLLPVGAGALVSWWRRGRPGGIAASMLAGAVVLVVDSVALLTHQWIAFNVGESGGSGERVSELPVFLIAVGLLGALLGLIGAASSAGIGHVLRPRRKPPSDLIWPFCSQRMADDGETPGDPAFSGPGGVIPRRLLRMAGGLALGAAVIVLFGVILPLAADGLARTSPKALPAFIANAVLNLVIGIGLLAPVSRRSAGPGKVLIVISGFVSLLLGFALLDAASVLGAKASVRVVAACGCLAGAAGGFGAGVLALVAAFRRNGRNGVGPLSAS